MEINSPNGKSYVVGDEIGKEERFKLYQCAAGENKVCILKIARQRQFNGLLDREAYLLKMMKKEAASLEEEYQKINKTDKLLNYQFFFPELIESFISEEQDNCRISILSLAHIADDLRELSPISHLTSRDHVRVDPQSSAWILGKLLKMLVFTQSQYISGLDLNGENILINRRQHYVTLFAWTEAILGNGEISPMIAQDEIAKVAFEVRIILGGDPTTGKLPPDKQLPDDQYENFIRSLIAGREKDASEAHRKCYELIHSLWPRKFHEFTTYSI